MGDQSRFRERFLALMVTILFTHTHTERSSVPLPLFLTTYQNLETPAYRKLPSILMYDSSNLLFYFVKKLIFDCENNTG